MTAFRPFIPRANGEKPTAAELAEVIASAASIVTQHNLLSTATEEERRATINRCIDWRNHVGAPALVAFYGDDDLFVKLLEIRGRR